MRPVLACLLLVTVAAVGPASAQTKATAATAGTYEVSYEEVSNNCNDVGMNLSRGSLKLTTKGKDSVTVDIERIPLMTGSVSKAGKFKASSKIDRTSIQGLDGKFSAAGRVDEGLLQMIFIAEYYVDKKPLCTQSWNVSGLRADK